jgi:ElaB/YqjD/DUF883 family membrane-anchored ribosome-binding protein
MNHRTGAKQSVSPEELLTNLQKLMDQVEAAIAEPAEGADEENGQLISQLKDRLSTATAKLNGVYKNARRRVIDGAQKADETIRSHPYESLAVALGVGVLLGALLRRRSD